MGSQKTEVEAEHSDTPTTEGMTSDNHSKQSRIISKVLSPAVRLWLRSQVQQVAHLDVQISGSDRQILTGYIPHVAISAQNAVYQGLYLTNLQLQGKDIRTNLGGVLRGQPLRLLEPVPVFGEAILAQSDLNASLKSPLLAEALTTLLKTFLPENSITNETVAWEQVILESDRLTIHGTIHSDRKTPLMLDARLGLVSSQELALKKLQIHSHLGLQEIDDYQIDLGSEVAIEKLTLNSGQLLCCGRINVLP
ncbi:DUF2993 domain-containing protein [Chroococcidiopsis sp. TS-821]|uniref:LmeA family phospholipid-binding protein n=1 Tax=Chroococcidiopsis sp. TS-821 TaxID=1378066 RepID=UPI001AEF97B2|nr:DUF2993 domain-containing protein [Chroococcidiopsis sp. TS-821]